MSVALCNWDIQPKLLSLINLQTQSTPFQVLVVFDRRDTQFE